MLPTAVVAALCWAGGYRSIIGDSAMRWGSPPKPAQPAAMAAAIVGLLSPLPPLSPSSPSSPLSLLMMGADGRVTVHSAQPS